jgi:hypothetical protein
MKNNPLFLFLESRLKLFDELPIYHSENCKDSPMNECNDDCPYKVSRHFLIQTLISSWEKEVEILTADRLRQNYRDDYAKDVYDEAVGESIQLLEEAINEAKKLL